MRCLEVDGNDVFWDNISIIEFLDVPPSVVNFNCTYNCFKKLIFVLCNIVKLERCLIHSFFAPCASLK